LDTPNDTFGQIWNRVLLYAPDLPPPLAQEFVKNAYTDAIRSHYWSELRQDEKILFPTQYTTGTVTVTNGSATVAASATAVWTTSMLYRQIAVGGISPWYTIIAVDTTPGACTFTLDRTYGGASESGASYIVGQFYMEFPSNLLVLEKIRDRNNGWYLVTQWYTQEYLDRVDAKRTSSGTPVIAVAAPSRTAADGTVIPRYEFWPKVLAERPYNYRYRKEVHLTNSTDRILAVLHPELLVYGALKYAALWPGLAGKPNPMFSQELYKSYSEQYEDELQQCIISDENRDQQMVKIADDVTRRFPFDAKYLQDHIW